MPSIIYADEVDDGICGSSAKSSGQLDSSRCARSALLVFLIVPSSWKSAGGTAVSSTSLRSTPRLLQTARSRQNNTSVSIISFRSLSFDRVVFMSANASPQMLIRCTSLMVPKNFLWAHFQVLS